MRAMEKSLRDIEIQAEGLRRFASNIIEHVAVLKKELGDGGASKGSARKGSVTPREKARVLAKIQKNRTKKNRPL